MRATVRDGATVRCGARYHTVAQGKQALSDRATCEVAPGEASAALGAATLQSSDIATGRSQTESVSPRGPLCSYARRRERGQLEREGAATRIAPLLGRLEKEVHDNLNAWERHHMTDQGCEVTPRYPKIN